jgi:Ser/Thr protein kinase RdoA (MazF antagonist)
MADAPPPPFAGLDPSAILSAAESVGLVPDGRILALNSYENRVFRIGLEDAAPRVIKFYRPGRWSDAAILEEHSFSAELREADLSVVAPQCLSGHTLHHHGGHRLAVFPLQGGHAPEPGQRAVLQQIGRSLGRLHEVGAHSAFHDRATLSVKSHAIASVEYLLDADWLPPELEDNFIALCEQVLDAIEDGFADCGPYPSLRLHGDCHPGNILWRDDAPHFVDLDDAMAGPAIQDLWMLATGDPAARAEQLRWLLEGYEVFRDLDRRQLHLLEPLRAMRLLHYHAWIARRWHDPAFPAAFPWFALPRHWEEVIVQLQEQLLALREPVLNLSTG